MTRLYRPHIPLPVRVTVAFRQLVERKLWSADHLRIMVDSPMARKKLLGFALGLLFKGRKHELHHRPALENRPFNRRTRRYTPDANDPRCLIYLENNIENNEHYIETHVRGLRGQRSDTGTRNHQKALDRNRGKLPRKPKRKIPARARALRKLAGKPVDAILAACGPSRKFQWPSRPFPKRRHP